MLYNNYNTPYYIMLQDPYVYVVLRAPVESLERLSGVGPAEERSSGAFCSRKPLATAQVRNMSLYWVAVEELQLSYHNMYI